MVIPNILSLVILGSVVAKHTKNFEGGTSNKLF
jgi:Na+/alanine symporter